MSLTSQKTKQIKTIEETENTMNRARGNNSEEPDKTKFKFILQQKSSTILVIATQYHN